MMRPAFAARRTAVAAALQRLPPGPRLLACALAGWITLVTLLAGADLLAGFAGEPAPEPVAAAPGAAAPSLGAIAERPLFSMSRRPDAPAPVSVPGPPPQPQRDRQISLKGVYIDGAQAKAFVTSAEKPEGEWVSRGSAVGGWRVAGVSAQEIRLEAEGESFSPSMNPAAGHP